MAKTFNVVQDGLLLTVSGELNGENSKEIVSHVATKDVYTIDFDEVETINYGALRVLLHHRQMGFKFMIINVSEQVGGFIERTGVSSIISICYKARKIDINDYVLFGESFISDAYNSKDGDSMIKVAKDCAMPGVFQREKVVARAALQFGLPTPIVGDVIESEGRMGLEFERICNKKSFARAISDNPEQLVEYAQRFARMTKKLHTTPCDTTVFADRSLFYHDLIKNAKAFDETQKTKMHAFVDKFELAETCLHGDLHIGNVITNGNGDLWIDLSDFGYGNPLFDLGMFYFISHCNPEMITMKIYHITNQQYLEVWNAFLPEYCGTNDAAELKAFEEKVREASSLHALFLGECHGFLPPMMELINEYMLK